MTKPTKWSVRTVKTRINLGIRPVWSESSLCAQWVAKKEPNFLHADSEDWSDWMCPGWAESSLGAHIILLILSWGGSFKFEMSHGLEKHKKEKEKKNSNIVHSPSVVSICNWSELNSDGKTVWAMTWQNLSSGISDQARHKPAYAATEPR